MNKQMKIIVILALLLTLATVIIWQLTGGDYYTKFEVVEEIAVPVDPNDPLAGTGFYDGQTKQTVVRDEFRLGLLPTPNSLFDKHLLSVVTIVSPVWVIALALLWQRRRNAHRRENRHRSA